MPADTTPDVKALVAELAEALRDRPMPLLLTAEQAWSFLGVSRSTFWRLLSAGDLPEAVSVPGSGPRWKRADLERWTDKLKARRRKPRAPNPPLRPASCFLVCSVVGVEQLVGDGSLNRIPWYTRGVDVAASTYDDPVQDHRDTRNAPRER